MVIHSFVFPFSAPSPSEIFDGSVSGVDIDYQEDRDHISASWFKVEDPESDIVKLTWCIGSIPTSCDQMHDNLINVTSTKVTTFLPQPANEGDKYYVTVTAVNGAGSSNVMVSNGVTIDYTSPTPGMVVVGRTTHVEYIKPDETIHAHWSSFKDAVSGIKSYQFALCEDKNSSACPLVFTDIGLQTNITVSGW